MKYAPVLITTLCRSKHFIRLIESLKRNSWAKYTDVFIALDYPPSEKYVKGWENINNYVENGDFSVFSSFHISKRPENVGAEKNLYLQFRELMESPQYDRYIFLEDDIEVSENFLEYMDKCLEEYENDNDIIAITGYSYPVDWVKSDNATCMKQNFNCSTWGIGFWIPKRSFVRPFFINKMIYKSVGKVIKQELYKNMIDACLREYIQAVVSPYKKTDAMITKFSDIGYRAYMAVENKYVISPIISKTRNHGFDGSGLYCQRIDSNDHGQTAGTYNYSIQPIDTAKTFTPVLNPENNLNENRSRLNTFDERTPTQMRRTRFYLWLMTHVGVWSAKMIASILFPFDIVIKIYQKITK